MGSGKQHTRRRRRDHATQNNFETSSIMDFDNANQEVSPSVIQHLHASFFFSDPAKPTKRKRE